MRICQSQRFLFQKGRPMSLPPPPPLPLSARDYFHFVALIGSKTRVVVHSFPVRLSTMLMMILLRPHTQHHQYPNQTSIAFPISPHKPLPISTIVIRRIMTQQYQPNIGHMSIQSLAVLPLLLRPPCYYHRMVHWCQRTTARRSGNSTWLEMTIRPTRCRRRRPRLHRHRRHHPIIPLTTPNAFVPNRSWLRRLAVGPPPSLPVVSRTRIWSSLVACHIRSTTVVIVASSRSRRYWYTTLIYFQKQCPLHQQQQQQQHSLQLLVQCQQRP